MKTFFKLSLYLILVSLIDSNNIKIDNFASGMNGGTYHKMARSLKGIAGVDFKIVKTEGTIENIKRLLHGSADIAFAQLDIYSYLSFRDEAIRNNIKVLLPVYWEELHIITDLEVEDFRDLRYQKLAMGPDYSGSRFSSRIILEALGFSNLSYERDERPLELVFEELIAGKSTIAATFMFSGAPIPILKEKQNSGLNLKLLPITEKQLKKIRSKTMVFKPKIIPANTYPWQLKPVNTLAVQSVLICKASLDSYHIKKFVKGIIKNQKSLVAKEPKWKEFRKENVGFLFKVMKGNMHPGAIEALDDYRKR